MLKDEQNDQNNNPNTDAEAKFSEYKNRRKKGKLFGGILIVLVGAAMLAREMGVLFPHWLFSWQILLIVIGLYVGVKHSFRNFSWIILILIGGAFLLEDFIPDLHFRIYFWPLFIIAIGLLMIFKPHRRYDSAYYRNKWERKYNGKWNRCVGTWNEGAESSEDSLTMEIIFSGFKKNIISKSFKGGTISCVFGGGDLNLSQADINGTVVLEIEQVFSGIKIIVPPTWEIRTDELQSTFGGIDDKRPTQVLSPNPDKILVIKGKLVFGGIDIRSY